MEDTPIRQTRRKGFSLVELMITIAVLVILISLAAPHFSTLVENHRTSSTTNALASALNLARSEAVRRGLDAAVCPDGNDWEDGWETRVYAMDEDPSDCGQGTVLQHWAGPASTIQVAANGPLAFDALGAQSSPEPTDATMRIWPQGCSGERARSLHVEPGGRVSTRPDNCPE
ncbi:pre-pilin like leader sequence [Thioalkalivibrio sp. K90mix]|uniref:GspH/FimT family pseudopilin n=1 Tax=Thioalkalivibrio sp. (strain K90mix) TaxID=396595 RepID=UPI000195A387|nr:GspH/FimT family pseudopilin [Thioalkalivibrio sp. K90mix]ADC70729.1 pre-pilin like leader sequence [Thioalkalivibrio sp. K90mix]